MKFGATDFRRLLMWIAIPLATSSSMGLQAQVAALPPPELLLTQPRPAVLMVGPLDVHTRASLLFMYDDNISLYEQAQPSGGIQAGRNKPPLGDDFIFSFAPGVVFNKASTLEDSRTAFSVDYSPAFIFFLKNDEENSVDHSVRFNGGYALTKLTLGVAQEYASTAGGVVEVGNRVSQENYRTAANARYELTEKTFLQIDGIYRITDYETLTDSEEWNVTTTANYQFSPKLALGLGGNVGQLYVTEESRVKVGASNTVARTTTQSQTYFGPTLRASYRTTEKTDVSLSFGGEFRMYEDGSSSFGPIFAVTASYRPFDTTSFSFEAHRNEQNSAVLNGQNYVATGLSVAVRQQLRERLSGHFSFSFNNSEYKAAERNVRATRSDDYYLLRYGLDAIIGRSWTIGVFHQYREDISSDKSFSFSNNQAGIQVSWAY